MQPMNEVIDKQRLKKFLMLCVDTHALYAPNPYVTCLICGRNLMKRWGFLIWCSVSLYSLLCFTKSYIQNFAGCCIPNAKVVWKQDGKPKLNSIFDSRVCVCVFVLCTLSDLDLNVMCWVRYGFSAMTAAQTRTFGFIWSRINAVAVVPTIQDRHREALIVTLAPLECLRLLVQPVNL